MKIFQLDQTREQYFKTQIDRCNTKFSFSKVSSRDVKKYYDIILNHKKYLNKNNTIGPVVCMGTRKGREIDLFRVGKLRWLSWLVGCFEINFQYPRSLLFFLYSFVRSSVKNMIESSVVGVEINPRSERKDVLICSFDDLPADWSKKFEVLFSNSFDQSQCPHKTADAWKAVLRDGGYFIICIADDAEPTETDPVGLLTVEDVKSLFKCEVVYYSKYGSRAGY